MNERQPAFDESLVDFFERTKRAKRRSLRKLGHRAEWMETIERDLCPRKRKRRG